MVLSSDGIKNIDTSHAVEIADRIWWVGHVSESDSFQCHSYLIEQGDNSVLIDPGSKITFSSTLRKINEVIAFSSIRYFVCQHQDPDITAALPLLDQLVLRRDAVVVTHGRTKILLKHYGLTIPFYLVEDNEWTLALDDRTLRFCFTPYAHFPGAFATYDPKSRVMFTSDLFGGITEKFSLFAEDQGYAECMKPFHQHYMPNNDILLYALEAIEKHDMDLIAPQHGSIIPRRLIADMIASLKSLDCGLYLLQRKGSNVMKLYDFDETLRNITRTMTIYRDFRDIAAALFDLIKKEISIGRLEFYVRDQDNRILHYAEKNAFRGIVVDKTVPAINKFFEASEIDAKIYREHYELVKYREGAQTLERLHVPLFLPDQVLIGAVLILVLEEKVEADQIAQLVDQMYTPLQVSIERELMYREIEKERDNIYQRSIRDPLTGLYTRTYMKDVVQKIIDQQDRDRQSSLVAIMMDIDHFKRVNDTWGHNQGDLVLKRVAEVTVERCRGIDIPIRLGGEEFVVFSQIDEEGAVKFAERLRENIAALQWEAPMDGERVTTSTGIALRKLDEPLDIFISRADEALYEAKHRGRNRVCFYPTE